MLKYISLLLVLVVSLSSCSKDDPAGPPGETFIKAKAGSTFTFDEYSTDSTNSIVAGSRDTMIATILRTDGVIGGKTGVLLIEENRRGVRDTVYYAYETNGNFSFSYPSFPTWETIPTGTGTTIIRETWYSFIGIDTSVTYDSTITSFLGTENITIKGESVAAKKMQLRFRHVVTYNGVLFTDLTLDSIFFYAPSLGFVVKTESPSRPDPFGFGWIDGRFQTLIDYDLK